MLAHFQLRVTISSGIIYFLKITGEDIVPDEIIDFQPRKYLIYFSRAVDRHTGDLIGYLSDLSTGGAMIISPKQLEPNTHLHLSIDLPEGFSPSILNLNARVIWCNPDSDSDTYRSGIQLLNVTAQEMSLLGRVLSKHGVQHQTIS